MAKDRYTKEIVCPKCGETAKAVITENDGFSFMKRGSEPKITSITNEISVEGSDCKCNKCGKIWEI